MQYQYIVVVTKRGFYEVGLGKMATADQGVIHPETHCNSQCGGGDVSPKSLSKMEFRIWSFNEFRMTLVDRLLEDIQDAKLQLVNEIDAIDFWKQMRIAHVNHLLKDIQDAKLQLMMIVYCKY